MIAMQARPRGMGGLTAQPRGLSGFTAQPCRGFGDTFWTDSNRNTYIRSKYRTTYGEEVPSALFDYITRVANGGDGFYSTESIDGVISSHPPQKADAPTDLLVKPDPVVPPGPEATDLKFTPPPPPTGIADWWAARSSNEKIGVVAGALAAVAAVAYLAMPQKKRR